VTAFLLELCDYAYVSISPANPRIKAAKIGGVAALVLLLLFAALGPAKMQYRTGLGWQVDHVVGYFGFTLMICLAWPRPVIVGAALMLAAVTLEALQALTPDRFCDFLAALYSVGGALAGALFFDPFNRILQYLRAHTRLITGWLAAMLPAGNEAAAPLGPPARPEPALGTTAESAALI
jgi:VanZ family protein